MATTIRESIPFRFGTLPAHLFSIEVTNSGTPHQITNAILIAAGFEMFNMRHPEALILLGTAGTTRGHYTVDSDGALATVAITTANTAQRISILLLGR
jgi:hypothetical protein